MTTPTVTRTLESIRIKFGKQMHLNIVADDLAAIQAWVDKRAAKYCIEYTMTGGATVLTEYTNHAHFIAILAGLEAVLW